MQAPTGGAPGVQTQGRKGDDGSHTASPPPLAEGQVPRLVPAPCLRRAYARGRTARTPPPPHPLLPHPPRKGARTARRWRGDMGGGQRTDRHAGRRDGRRAVEEKKTKQTNAPGEESGEAGTNTAAYGGGAG